MTGNIYLYDNLIINRLGNTNHLVNVYKMKICKKEICLITNYVFS